MFASPRRLLLASFIVLAHAAALWALHSGLLRRAVEAVVVPVQVLSQFIEPAAPRPAPAPPASVPPELAKPSVPATPALSPTPAEPIVPVSPATQQSPAVSPAPASATASVAPPIQAPTRLETPSSQAEYLQNPKPVYPALSRRLGEQGRVMVRVLVGADGLPQRIELGQSSGFERLDQAALATVQRWRFVPGKRNGVPEAMWFNVPIDFKFE